MKNYQNEFLNIERKRLALVLFIGAMLVTVWGYSLNSLVPQAVDPISTRILISALMLSCGILIYFEVLGKKTFFFNLYFISIFLLKVTADNNYHHYYLLGSFLTFICCGIVLSSLISLTILYLLQMLALFSFRLTSHHSSQSDYFYITLVFTSGYLIILLGTWDRLKLIQRLEKLNQENESLTKDSIAKSEQLLANALTITFSHEVNNPLAIAISYLDLIKKKGIQKNYLEKVTNSLDRINKIIKKIQKIDTTNLLYVDYIEGKPMLNLDEIDD